MYIIKNNQQTLETSNLNDAVKKALNLNDSKIYKNNKLFIDTTKDIFEVPYNNHIFKVNKLTKKYIDIPIKYYSNSALESHLEYHTGCYNYLYSKEGFNSLKAFFSLENSIITLSNNDTKYNAYVLFNHQSIDQIDVGLCIRYQNNEILCQPFYYYMGGIKPKVFYLDNFKLSKFIKINNTTFKGIDTFHIELKTTPNGWYFKIDVINKNISYEKHIEIDEHIHQEILGRFLVGASLVPVNDDLYDPLSSASFTNVLFNEVLLNNETLLYPSSKTMHKGYSQGYPFADMKINKNSFIFETIYK